MQMLTLYRRLFSELGQHSAEYAVWKNSQELPEALQGSGDIDLYVYPGSNLKFLAVLRDLQFVCLKSHKAFPCVQHYYGYDENSGKFAHLHCYFRIVTGESHIKQYVVPIEPYLDHFPALVSDEGISSLHPVLQKKLNVFRRKIKLSCLPGALLFFRERNGYRLEREMTTNALSGKQSGSVDSNVMKTEGWLGEIEESSSLFHEVVDGFRYRLRYQQWNRFNPFMTPIHRYAVILSRLHGKVFKRKKTFPVGLILAIAGFRQVDTHQDKETMTHRWLGKHFSVHIMQRPRHWRAFHHLMASVQADDSHADAHHIRTPLPLHLLIRLAWEARRWREQVRRSVYWSTAGSIVIWNPDDVVEARRALHFLIKANGKGSWINRYLLQICKTCLEIEPVSDARFLVASARGIDRATTHERREDPIIPGDESSASASPELCQEHDSSVAREDYVRIEVCKGCTPDECGKFKAVLWNTVADLQC